MVFQVPVLVIHFFYTSFPTVTFRYYIGYISCSKWRLPISLQSWRCNNHVVLDSSENFLNSFNRHDGGVNIGDQILLGLDGFSHTKLLMYSHRKKSRRLKLGERGGHSTGSLRPIQRPPNVWMGCSRIVRVMWGTTTSVDEHWEHPLEEPRQCLL